MATEPSYAVTPGPVPDAPPMALPAIPGALAPLRWHRRLAVPGPESFALLFALESLSRSLLVTVLPIQAFELLGTAGNVSVLFFAASIFGISSTFALPALARRFGLRALYTAGAGLLLASPMVLAADTPATQLVGMILRVFAVVTLTICLNLYIMAYVRRREFMRAEPLRVFYAAGAWTVGPALGIWLGMQVTSWLPFLLASLCAGGLIAYFRFLGLGDGRQPAAVVRPQRGPLRRIGRFAAQPRLALAWGMSTARNAWWQVFFIYTPIFAVRSGLDAVTGGIVVSLGSGFLFLLPLWGWGVRRFGIRRIALVAFWGTGLFTASTAVMSDRPYVALGLVIVSAFFAVALDAVGNAPFMLSVRSHERAEMTAVYTTYRDVAELAPPGIFSILLRVLPLPAVFVVTGVAMLAMGSAVRRMHPRLGTRRPPAGTRAPPAAGAAAPTRRTHVARW